MTNNDIISFVRSIDDKELVWNFQLIDGLTVKGKVLDYILNEFAMPISIVIRIVDGDNDGRILEIPWTSIQFITQEDN